MWPSNIAGHNNKDFTAWDVGLGEEVDTFTYPSSEIRVFVETALVVSFQYLDMPAVDSPSVSSR